MNRRPLGTEELTFIDGTTKEITFHSVSSLEKIQQRAQFLKQKFDSNGKIESADFETGGYISSIIKLGTDSSKLLVEEIAFIENPDLQELFDKYYGDLSKEKKSKFADTAEQKPDKK